MSDPSESEFKMSSGRNVLPGSREPQPTDSLLNLDFKPSGELSFTSGEATVSSTNMSADPSESEFKMPPPVRNQINRAESSPDSTEHPDRPERQPTESSFNLDFEPYGEPPFTSRQATVSTTNMSIADPSESEFKIPPPVRNQINGAESSPDSTEHPDPPERQSTVSSFNIDFEPSGEVLSTSGQATASSTNMSIARGSNVTSNLIPTPTVSALQLFHTRPLHKIITNCTGNSEIYKEPLWSSTPPEGFYLEMIKQGVVLSQYRFHKPYLLIGRLPGCDIRLEHPSVSRYHAVLQYCKGDDNLSAGFYVYDLNSTHGTFINKSLVNTSIFCKIKQGHVLKFGSSTRIFVLEGPKMEDGDGEDEEEMVLPKPEKEYVPFPSYSACNWGMNEDAIEDNVAENPFSLPLESENLNLSDPKKTLRGWYEREGFDFDFKVEETAGKKFICSIRLPVDDPSGDDKIIEGAPAAKRKEAIVHCMLEACRILDRMGLLRQSQHESRQRKRKNWEADDYYDSDEDPFLDRTGALEKKREWRRKLTKKPLAETPESIEDKIKTIDDQIDEIHARFENSRERTQMVKTAEEIDPLDSYMSELQETQRVPLDPVTISKLKNDLVELEKRKKALEQLRDGLQPFDPSQNIQPPPAIPEFGAPKKFNRNEAALNLSDNVKKKSSMLPVALENLAACCSSSSQSNPADLVSTSSDLPLTEPNNLSSSNEIELIDLTDDQEEIDDCFNKDILLSPPKSENAAFEQCFNRDSPFSPPKSENAAFEECFNRDSPLSPPKSENASCEQNVKVTYEQPVSMATLERESSDYSMWLPPMNQSGDGSTDLNSKFGY